MKYIDESQEISILKYPLEIQDYLNRMEKLDGVETFDYFDLSDGLEKFLEPFLEEGIINQDDVMKLAIRYSYTLEQIEMVKGVRLF